MGLTHVTVAVSNLAQDQPPFEADFLVDAGAVDCLAPADELVAAGIGVEGKAVYELANGEPVEYEYGFARVKFMGAETVAQVVLARPALSRSSALWHWKTRGSPSIPSRARYGDCTPNR